MKKTLLILLKVIVAIVILLALFLVIVFTVNVISNKVEKGKIDPMVSLYLSTGKR